MHKRLLLILITILGAVNVGAQKFLYDVDFVVNFDNVLHNRCKQTLKTLSWR